MGERLESPSFESYQSVNPFLSPFLKSEPIGSTRTKNMQLEVVDLDSSSTANTSAKSASTDTENNSFAQMSPLDMFRSESTEVMDKIREGYNKKLYKGEKDQYGLIHVKPTDKSGKPLHLSYFKEKLEGEDYDYEVVECIFDEESGLDSLIVKDQYGNYKVSYGYTEGGTGDVMTDLIAGANDKLTPCINIPTKQTFQAEQVADYAYKMAKKDGTKLNFFGYSLGGCDTEYGVKYLYNKYDDAHDVIGSVTLLNPLHAPDLTQEDINNITGSNNFHYYANEMDLVHTINSFDKFKDYQLTLPAVTEGKHAWTKNQVTPGHNVTLIDATQNQGHMIEYLYDDDYINSTFDENGNVKKTSKNVYNTDQMLKKYYGFTLEDFNSVMKNEANYWLFDNRPETEDDEGHQGLMPWAPNILKDATYLLVDGLAPALSATYELFTTDWTDPTSVNHFASKTGARAVTTLTTTAVDAFAFETDRFGIPWLGDFVQEENKVLTNATYDVFDYGEKMINEDIKTGNKLINHLQDWNFVGAAQDIGENFYNKTVTTLSKGKEIWDEYFCWVPFGH